MNLEKFLEYMAQDRVIEGGFWGSKIYALSFSRSYKNYYGISNKYHTQKKY